MEGLTSYEQIGNCKKKRKQKLILNFIDTNDLIKDEVIFSHSCTHSHAYSSPVQMKRVSFSWLVEEPPANHIPVESLVRVQALMNIAS